jgi:hypothetical protein
MGGRLHRLPQDGERCAGLFDARSRLRSERARLPQKSLNPK